MTEISPRFLLLAALAGPAASVSFAAAARHWSVIETSRDTGHRLTAVRAPGVNDEAKVPSVESIITCDPAAVCQEIIGFGGALSVAGDVVSCRIPGHAIHPYVGAQQ